MQASPLRASTWARVQCFALRIGERMRLRALLCVRRRRLFTPSLVNEQQSLRGMISSYGRRSPLRFAVQFTSLGFRTYPALTEKGKRTIISCIGSRSAVSVPHTILGAPTPSIVCYTYNSIVYKTLRYNISINYPRARAHHSAIALCTRNRALSSEHITRVFESRIGLRGFCVRLVQRPASLNCRVHYSTHK